MDKDPGGAVDANAAPPASGGDGGRPPRGSNAKPQAGNGGAKPPTMAAKDKDDHAAIANAPPANAPMDAAKDDHPAEGGGLGGRATVGGAPGATITAGGPAASNVANDVASQPGQQGRTNGEVLDQSLPTTDAAKDDRGHGPPGGGAPGATNAAANGPDGPPAGGDEPLREGVSSDAKPTGGANAGDAQLLIVQQQLLHLQEKYDILWAV
ncbi:hypothetical protein ACHAXT_002847, partial [Thalassiosira profunda]